MIKGLAEAQAKLRRLEQNVKRAQRKGEKRAADLMAADAKSKAPGSLAGKILVTQNENSTTVIGGDNLSAYVEFGTGEFAASYLAGMPAEVQEEARQFYVNGQGRVPAQPFFFPAIYKNRDKVVAFVEEELQKLNK